MSAVKKKLRVLLMGYNGENNTGAESRLVTIARDVREVFQDQELKLEAVVLTAANARRYLKDPDVKMVEIGKPSQLWKVLQLTFAPYDLFILVEGSTFTDHFSPFLLYMFLLGAWIHSFKPGKSVAYAVDALEMSEFSKKLTRYAGNKIDLIITRNEDARDRLQALGITRDIIVTTDTAFQYQPPPREQTDRLLERLQLDPGKPLVGLAFKEFFWWPISPKLWGPPEDLYRFWPLYHTWGPGDKEKSAAMKGVWSSYADWLVEKYDANILWIAMERMDHPPSRDAYQLMRHNDRARLIPSNNYDLDDITGLLSRLKLLISARYHACVLSMVSAIPMLAVSHDTRIESLYKEFDHMKFYIDYQSPDLLSLMKQRAEELIQTEDRVRGKIRDAYALHLARCLKNREILKKWFSREFWPLPA